MALAIFCRIGVVAGWVAPVEVHVVPPALPPLPDPGLLGLRGEGVALFVQRLSDFNISNGGGVLAQ